jgi:UDP-glucose 4-epimerase
MKVLVVGGAGYIGSHMVKMLAQDGRRLLVQEGERRAGDPAVLVADAQLARKVLGWQPQYADLDTIVRHAWAWELRQI